MTNEPSKELMEEISSLQNIYAQAFKQDYLIHVVTEMITPVLVSAFTQEEAEHLALEKVKAMAAEEEKPSPALEKLWEVIGEAGCRLTHPEKAQVVDALTQIGFWYKTSTISGVFQDWDDVEIKAFAGTNPPSPEWDDYCEEIFGGILLSNRDAWLAVAEIAGAQLASERSEG